MLETVSQSVVSDSLGPMDCSPPGSSVHSILWARLLEWVAIPFSKGSFRPRDRTQVSCIAGRFLTTWATREAPVLERTRTFKTLPEAVRLHPQFIQGQRYHALGHTRQTYQKVQPPFTLGRLRTGGDDASSRVSPTTHTSPGWEPCLPHSQGWQGLRQAGGYGGHLLPCQLFYPGPGVPGGVTEAEAWTPTPAHNEESETVDWSRTQIQATWLDQAPRHPWETWKAGLHNPALSIRTRWPVPWPTFSSPNVWSEGPEPTGAVGQGSVISPKPGLGSQGAESSCSRGGWPRPPGLDICLCKAR